jgi:hypothetical protein
VYFAAMSHEIIQLTKDDISCVPDEPGVYEIGFYQRSQFNPHYVGRSNNLRRRLLEHASGRGGNPDIDDHVRSDKLYFRYFLKDDPECEEVRLQQSKNYDWNRKKESKQCKRSFF